MASSSSPLTVSQPKCYDVFLSFRGEDTRSNFTSHLYAALCQKNIDTFIDDEEINKEDKLSPTLVAAIERSKISIVIFSKEYASSRWCLDELEIIIECRERKKQVVIPVFYHIDPSHVRHQRGTYEDAFARHEERFKDNPIKVHKWRTALGEAADSSGWDSSNVRTEAELINQIVEQVLKRLKQMHMGRNDTKVLVGIHDELTFLESLVTLDSDDVRIIGIWGMGGIGKTTIAKELYNRLHSEYEATCFVPNIREKLEKYEITLLQNELVCALLGYKDRSIGIPIVEDEYDMERLRRKKILLVLDDVNDFMKLKNLYGGHNWFGQGSRVIVTSRDKQVLTNLGGDTYEVKALKFEDSLQLFSLNAFKENYPRLEWRDLSLRAVNYAGGIPLALEVLGSTLYGKEKEVWINQLEKLKKMPLTKIQNVLRLSYDALDREEQDIFLYLVCFFENHALNYMQLLDACGYSTVVGLTNLHDKALLTIEPCLDHKKAIDYHWPRSDWNWKMHDLIRDMGRGIVCGETRDPGKRRHLWDANDVYQVLENATLKAKYEQSSKELHLSPKACNGMFNLKLLKLDTFIKETPFKDTFIFSGTRKMLAPEGLESMPDGLTLLQWEGCPLKCLPSSFCAENLVEVDFSYSCLERLWDGVQNLAKLESINLSGCEQLMELPDFSKALNLRSVELNGCTSLSDLHPSILSLHNLEILYVNGCKNLKSLRSDLVLEYLQFVSALGCSSLEEFSVISKGMKCMRLTDTVIMEIPSLGLPLINNLEVLISERIPHNLLQQLDVREFALEFFTPRYGLERLTELDLSRSNIESLPTSIMHLSYLDTLVLRGCKRLLYLPELPPSTYKLDVSSCTSLEAASVSTIDPCWWQRHESGALFAFGNCMRLKPETLNTIMSDAYVMMKRAAYFQHLEPCWHTSVGVCLPRSVGVCLPGSKVPADYRTTTQDSITIQLSSPSNFVGFIGCFVVSRFRLQRQFGLTYYLQTSSGQKVEFASIITAMSFYVWNQIQYDSDHVILWQDPGACQLITEEIKESSANNQCATCNPELSVQLFVYEGEEDIQIKEWGIYPVYAADIFKFSQQLALGAKSKTNKRAWDTDDDLLLDLQVVELLPLTKKLKTEKKDRLEFEPNTPRLIVNFLKHLWRSVSGILMLRFLIQKYKEIVSWYSKEKDE